MQFYYLIYKNALLLKISFKVNNLSIIYFHNTDKNDTIMKRKGMCLNE
jgi:hypothetical protein